MRLPISWLSEFVPIHLPAERLAGRLTLGGFEVEEVSQVEGDWVLDVTVAPNRGDCLSVRGMAREVAALVKGRVKEPSVAAAPRPARPAGRSEVRSFVSVSVRDRRACPVYSLIVIDKVRVGPSPDWLVRRLLQVGLRSINNIVDVTNYVCMETGQPLHAFDLSRIAGRKIVVRRAGRGERLLTLDGCGREVGPEDLVIADERVPIALAGVIGGKETEVTEETRIVALESAFFDPVRVRRSSKRQGLQTESSYRFERVVDSEGTVPALLRASALIAQVSGGRPTDDWIQIRSGSPKRREILLRPEAVGELLGGDWKAPQISGTLRRLGFEIQSRGGAWRVRVPSFRPDVREVPDLVEEAARLSGLEKIPFTFPTLGDPPMPVLPSTETQGRELMVQSGLSEAIHFSFLSPKELEAFDPSLLSQAVSLKNPLGLEGSLLRPSLLPSLLKTAALHHAHRIFDVRLFELRRVFRRGPPGAEKKGILETPHLAAVLSGARLLSHWSLDKGETDFFDVKGLVEHLYGGLGLGAPVFGEVRDAALHPLQSVSVKAGDGVIGVLGELHPEVAERFQLKRRCFVVEIDWEPLSRQVSRVRHFAPFSRTPKAERDLSLLVGEEVPGGEIEAALTQTDARLRSVRLFDLYRGPPVPDGLKSLSLALEIAREGETLTEEEINEVVGKAIRVVQEKFGAKIR